MADKFGNTNHCIELFEECECQKKGRRGTGHFLLLEPWNDKEARVAGGWACGNCFKRNGQSPFPVGMWVGKKTKKAWSKVGIGDLILLKKVFPQPDKTPLIQYHLPPKRDNSNRDIEDFMSKK